MAMLKAEQNVKLSRSGSVFLLTKFGDLVSIGIYLALSSLLVWNDILPLHWLTLLLLLGIVAGLTLLLITILKREHFVGWTEKILRRLKLTKISLVERGLGALHSLAQGNQTLILKRLRTAVLLSLLYMTATMAFAYSGMRIFDVQVGIWAIIYVSSLMQLVSYVPIQVLGGLGVSEVTAVYLYSMFGVDQGEMSAVMLGLRALFYLMNAAMLLYFPLEALWRRAARRATSRS
jgi:uncharacterized protein (TIRG00374 family)